MTATRRDWLARATLGLGLLALPRPLAARLAGAPTGAGRYLQLARDCGRWIMASAQSTPHGTAWPADPLKPESVALDFYNGMPGVVVFLAELGRATGEPRWLDAARRGAAHLAHEMEHRPPGAINGGLYTGLAGLAFTFFQLERADAGQGHASRAARALALLEERAEIAAGGVHWQGAHDIVFGNAGILLLLLEAHRRTGDPRWLALATRAGSRLIEVSEPARGGRMWYPSHSMRRNMPNFSHGTAGVAYALATLFEATRNQRFLDAALDGARYLDAIAVRRGDGTLIHHHDGGGEELFYLSWCHGPAGTARLFHRLHAVTGEARWRDWVRSLAAGLFDTGIPERRTPGFWNNISQCCGNVGVGKFALDLAVSGNGRDPAELEAMIRRVVDDTRTRATSDERGLRWIQAEHRVQPDNLVAQTGFMQGAAGVGAFLLELDALETGRSWRMTLPDSPFA